MYKSKKFTGAKGHSPEGQNTYKQKSEKEKTKARGKTTRRKGKPIKEAQNIKEKHKIKALNPFQQYEGEAKDLSKRLHQKPKQTQLPNHAKMPINEAQPKTIKQLNNAQAKRPLSAMNAMQLPLTQKK